MREIKFRAWDLRGKPHMVDALEGDNLNRHLGSGHPVMQYTGLKDKNGVEIYEGDILRNVNHKTAAQVFWDDTFAGFALMASPYKAFGWNHPDREEVIGNIYQNPELLQGGEK